jgi:hypothetical protein
VVQTTVVIIVFTILFSCTLAILGAKRQVANSYLLQEQYALAKNKILECRLNAAMDFLYTMDTVMLSKNNFSYDELLHFVEDKTFERAYSDGFFSTFFEAHFSLKGSCDKRLDGLPEYDGTKFYVTLNYNISNLSGLNVCGEDSFYISCSLNFRLILDELEGAREFFESQLFSKFSEKLSKENVSEIVYEVTGLVKSLFNCDTIIENISVNENFVEVHYKLAYPTVYVSMFEEGVSNNIIVYYERPLRLEIS